MGSSNSDDAVVNQYEKQLYTVFKSFDVNDAEALDRAAVRALCDSLQLEDRGATLLDALFMHSVDRVTFAQFRTGLLTVLSAEPAASDPAERALSDGESSSCEVAPRFVFGSKKYGRRSRPQRLPDASLDLVQGPALRSSSASRLDCERPRPQLGRSASVADARTTDDERPPRLDPAHRIDRIGALALCRGLGMDRVDDLVERIFETAPDSEPTVGEFFGRLNAELATTIEGANGAASDRSPDGLDDEAAGGVPTDLIVEEWEHAGVPRPRALLNELGFCDATLRPSDLERALDEELNALRAPRDEGALLQVASLSVSRLRTRLARQRGEAAVAERDKLRADVSEANARARLLAQEVDENHARIETELNASLRRAEVRHAEAVRAAEANAASERERAAAALSRLEIEVARRADVEARLHSEASELRVRLSEAEARAVAAEERFACSERERARLTAEVVERRKGDHSSPEGVGLAGAELVARLEALRCENEALRDRNDELVAELEAGTRSSRTRAGGEAAVTSGDLSAELANLLPPGLVEDCESSPVSLEQLSCRTECDSPGATVGTGRLDSAVQTDSLTDQIRAESDLQQQLNEVQHAYDEDKCRLEALIKELETGLEQMKSEYDRCEEYWSQKLEQERALHGEETRAGDERLAELLARVRDYELQYARARCLPPIDEKRSLEMQVTELEEEFGRYRRDKEAELAERDRELQRLRDRVGAAPDRRTGLRPEVEALRARTARAEGTVRRLHARLAAADLLVKDLYLENCHLAHRNRL